MPEPPMTLPRRSIDHARERDARIEWLLGTHPVTADMLVRIGWFPSRDKALKRLRTLTARGRVRLVGTACRKAGGRPEHVYCLYRVKADQLLHEVELTEVCLRIDAGQVLRGPHATDADLRPDAELLINGQRYCLELDRGTMSAAQIAGRFRRYERCPHYVLWVCPTAELRESRRRLAGALRSVALFTTRAEALAAPHGEIWVDYQGNTVALPRQRRDVGEGGA